MAKIDRTTDEPWIDKPDEKAFEFACPKCGADVGDECTSMITGCCPDGVHGERDALLRGDPDVEA